MTDLTNRHALELSSQLGARVLEQTVDYKLVRVLNLFNMYILKGDESVGPHLESEGCWESWITTWFMDNVDQDTTFFDIGANTGYYSFLAAKLGADIFSFEPNPIYFNMMQKSSKRNGLSGYWFRQAVSDANEKVTLSIPEHLHGSASIMNDFTDTHNGTNIEVQAVPLDYWTDFHIGKTLIKIDAEGAEEKVWNGSALFREAHHPTIMIEWTPGAYSDQFYSRLEEYGQVCWINHGGSLEAVDRAWVESQNDWVMLVVR